MRISTNQIQIAAGERMVDQQSKLSKVQQQVSTGLRVMKPSDDPVASAQLINFQNVKRQVEQYQANSGAATARLSLESGVLEGVTEVLQRARELAVYGNNGSQTNETRSYIAEEIDQLNEELMGLANTIDAEGEFLFAGSKGRFRPFSRDVKGQYVYSGDDTQRSIKIGPRRTIPVNDTGTEVFRKIREGNGEFVVRESPNNKGSGVVDQGTVSGEYNHGVFAIIFDKKESPHWNEPLTYKVIDEKGQVIVPPGTKFVEGNDIKFEGVQFFIQGKPEVGDFFVIRPSGHKDAFTMLSDLSKALKQARSGDSEKAHLHNEVNLALSGIDASLDRSLDVSADVGTRLRALDNQKRINEDFLIQLASMQSNVEDLDYGKAMTEFNLRKAGLDASQKSFVRVQDLNLFNYI